MRLQQLLGHPKVVALGEIGMDRTIPMAKWSRQDEVFKAKSRKYQGVFEVKSRVKTWQVRGIWSQQLEH